MGRTDDSTRIYFWDSLCVLLPIVYGFLLAILFAVKPLESVRSYVLLTLFCVESCSISCGFLCEDMVMKMTFTVLNNLCLSPCGARLCADGRHVFTCFLTPLHLAKYTFRSSESNVSWDGNHNKFHEIETVRDREISRIHQHNTLQRRALEVSLFLILFLILLSRLIDADKNCLGRIVVASSASINACTFNNILNNNNLAVVCFLVVRCATTEGLTRTPWMLEMRKNLALAKPKVLSFNSDLTSRFSIVLTHM